MNKLIAGLLCLTFIMGTANMTMAQQDQEEMDDVPKYATMTSFEIPHHVRDKVIPYMVEHVVPYNRLNPNVVTFRVLIHTWGSNASTIAFYSEYMEFADIEADCGQPCKDYEAEHTTPKEGDDGYEKYVEGKKLYQKYNSDHNDEIYRMPKAMKIQGENIGPIGPSEEG